MQQQYNNRSQIAAMAVTLVFPSVLTFAYFVLFAGHSASSAIYGFGKLLQFGFPAVWVFVVLREKFQWAPLQGDLRTRKGILFGAVFGLFIAAAMIALALLWLQPIGFLDEPREAIREKLRDMHIDSLVPYLFASIFYCVFHSLLEEYYWRWFVFRRLQPFVGTANAIVISSLGFMAHHVIVLAEYFGWTSPATALFSACVAVGGAVWAWTYERSGSIYAPWISHALVDGGIFTLGYLLGGFG